MNRMKTLSSFEGLSVRFVALSATIPNYVDVADWLADERGSAVTFHFNDECRPVPIYRHVLSFPDRRGQNSFVFDHSLNYKCVLFANIW